MTLAQSYTGSATQSVGASPLLNKAWHMLPPPDFKRWSLVEPRACDPRLVEHLPGILSLEELQSDNSNPESVRMGSAQQSHGAGMPGEV